MARKMAWLLGLAAGGLAAVSAAAPKPAGPGEFLAATYGFRMTPGAGWRWEAKEDTMVFGHSSIPGALLVTALAEPVSAEDLVVVTNKGYRDDGEGTDLKPVNPGASQVVSTGAGQGRFFAVTGTLQGEAIAGHLGVFLPPGAQAVSVLAVTAPAQAEALAPHARRILASVRLFAPERPAVREWDRELRGKRVQYIYSQSSFDAVGTGYSSASARKNWHLCADGSYWYAGSSHSHIDSSGGGGTAGLLSTSGRGDEQGTWRVVPQGEGAAIVFQPANGGGYRYRLHRVRKRGTSFMQKHFGDLGVYTVEAADCR